MIQLSTPEADLGIRLPGMLAQPEQVDLPDEQIIEGITFSASGEE